jgi:pyruvate kinase
VEDIESDQVPRHTKIIATIGPASQSSEVIEQLIHAGVDICRLNFSHGSQESHEQTLQRIRRAAAGASRVISILQDLSGPKIRTGRLEGSAPIELTEGDAIAIAVGDAEGRRHQIYTPNAELIANVKPGGRLLLDDGRIQLRVLENDGRRLLATVLDGGLLGEFKGINAPGVRLSGHSLTAKDIDDLKFGVRIGVDMVALSFVRSAGDLVQARELITDSGSPNIPLIAKIERPEALDCLGDILKVSQGVMIARGDLGLEIPLEQVPTSQKTITRTARRAGIPVILATQVLESMRSEMRPTRAEVSDAANAVDDGVDGIMLAGETAIGLHPVRAVETLDAVICEAERVIPAQTTRGDALRPMVDIPQAPHAQALCEAAVTLADRSNAFAIVAITRAGNTARILSALRPHAPIFAATETDTVARHLTIYWGVKPLITGIGKDADTTGTHLKQELRSRALIPPDSVVVFVSANAKLERPDQNFVNVQRIE